MNKAWTEVELWTFVPVKVEQIDVNLIILYTYNANK